MKYEITRLLTWPDLWNLLKFKKDKGGRWYPSGDTPEIICKYCYNYRAPSSGWPNSYATPLLTKKFVKYLAENDPELAVKYQLIKRGF